MTAPAAPRLVIDLAPARPCVAALLLGFCGPVVRVAAEPSRLEARVVWVRDDRVYIAAPDSLALEPGTRTAAGSRRD